jgi:hypothetical protein
MMIVWLIVAGLGLALLVGAWLWVRHIEHDDIDWEHGAQSSEEGKQTTELGIAVNINGTYSR